MSRIAVSVLMAGIALGAVTPAFAQTPDDVAALKVEIAALKAQLSAMEKRLDTVTTPAASPAVAAQTAPVAAPAKPAAPPPVDIAWSGAPQFKGAGGWSFKPRGRINFDVGHVSAPSGVTARTLGTNARFRRVRLGGEGTMPGGFGYRIDLELANGAVDFGDAILTYALTPELTARAGNFFAIHGMESMTPAPNNSFMERAGIHEAFVNGRRLGGAFAYMPKDTGLKLDVGLFAGHGVDATLDNDAYVVASRLTYNTKVMGGQLHLGSSLQLRHFSANNNGAPAAGSNQISSGQLLRVRSRPGTTLTDLRFVDTGSFAARSMRIVGAEAAVIFKGPYLAFEAQWAKPESYRSGDIATGLDSFGGANTAVTPTADPAFFGGYLEAGWYLTGETRAYRDGEWGRTKVANPLNKGGSGTFHVATRVDYLDLDDERLRNGLTNNFTTGLSSLAATDARLGRGGTQTSYALGLNWAPVDMIRFMLNYTHTSVDGGPFAAAAAPGSTAPVNERDFGVDIVAARMQLDF